MHRLPGQRILLRQLQRLQLPLHRQINKEKLADGEPSASFC